MAATVTPNARGIGDDHQLSGRLMTQTGTIAFDSEYATGGEALTFPGFREVAALAILPRGGYVFEWTGTKAKVFKSAASGAVMVEQTSSGDLSALSDVQYVAYGY